MSYLKAALVGLLAGYLLTIVVNTLEVAVAPGYVMPPIVFANVPAHGSAFGNNLPDLALAFLVGFSAAFTWLLRRQRRLA